MTAEHDHRLRTALRQALQTAAARLEAGAAAIDAVEAAVAVLEDDVVFNAGRGAVFTAAGRHELDAAIMDGRDRNAGAVASVTRPRNPIRLARAVLAHSPHVFLAGEGADDFAAETGVALADPDYFFCADRHRQWIELRDSAADNFDVDLKYSTVGAVARDRHGHVASATSTGGITGKRWGRIGDSPVIGAGTYADDRGCAVSATGLGEVFIRQGVAHDISSRVRLLGETPSAAAAVALGEVAALGGTGGVILIAPDGRPAWAFNTRGMCRGRAASGSPIDIRIYDDEEPGAGDAG